MLENVGISRVSGRCCDTFTTETGQRNGFCLMYVVFTPNDSGSMPSVRVDSSFFILLRALARKDPMVRVTGC